MGEKSNTGAGKGDKRRPTNEKVFRENYDEIFGFWGTCEECNLYKKVKTNKMPEGLFPSGYGEPCNICEECLGE